MAATTTSPLHLTSGSIKCALEVDSTQLASLIGHRDAFQASLPSHDTPPSSPGELALRFVAYLESSSTPPSILTAALSAFEDQFLSTTDIHTLALSTPSGVQAGRDLLRSYYDALSHCSKQPTPTPSALLSAAATGSKQLHLIFGGQGAANPACFTELRSLVSTYSPLLTPLLSVASAELTSLSRDPSTHGFYAGREIDLATWLADDSTVPDAAFLASAAVSFPLIGLVGLAHYAVTCQALAKTPGELRSLLRGGVTGHSQGLVVAAAVAQCGTWDEFFAAARDAVRLLFWLGFESHAAAPRSALAAADVQDCVDAGEGRPGMMLSVRGLRRKEVEELVARCNKDLAEDARVYVALRNTTENFTISGPARSLRGLCLHIRTIAAEEGVDQARVPFRRRKKVVRASFLPISAPFHSPYLAEAAAKVKERMKDAGCGLETAKMGLPVHHSKDGRDLRTVTDRSATDILIDAIALEPVDWPAALQLPGATHVVMLASGRLGDVVDMVKQGQGVIVVNAATLAAPDAAQTTKVDLFTPQLPAHKLHAASWSEQFRPRLVRDATTGAVQLDTRLSRVLGAPPVFTAGMTPTTVHWDFVAAVMNAGYHIEMAGGGYFEPSSMASAIEQAAASVPGGRGITVNLIYASPEAMRWQITLLADLQRRGVPVDGLTIGAGVPSPDIASGYITTLGLKHVGFKPGSTAAIRDVLAIADAHPRFPVVLQWTGGRGGGHHSYEDFHEPVLDLYAEIRRRANVVLVAGSGFGDAEGAWPYLSGEWATREPYARMAAMPFDGVLLGSRMMVAREAHTSPQSRELIVAAAGLEKQEEWDRTYEKATGGVLTVQSEMGQPIHKLATRGVKLWAELDKTVFSLPRAQRAAALARMRDTLIPRLNADFAKPWFAVDEAGSGPAAEVADMTYARVLARLVELTYLPHRKAFIDPSYAVLLRDVAQRTLDRLNPEAKAALPASSDTEALVAATRDSSAVAAWCPGAETRKLHPEDARWFVRRCKSRTMKPVNFIPVLDEDFEYFFKKDSLWQSENVDAVVGQDAGRVCILQSPVSVRYSQRGDESAKEILDGITGGLVEMVKKAFYPNDADIPLAETKEQTSSSMAEEVLPGVQFATEAGKQIFQLTSGQSPASDEWLSFMAARTSGWIHRLFADGYVVHDHVRTANPFHRILQLRPGEKLALDQANEGAVSITSATTGRPLCSVSLVYGPRVRATMWAPSSAGDDIDYSLEYVYMPSSKHCSMFSDSEAHDATVKDFYRRLWLPNTDIAAKTVHSTFTGPERVVSEQSVRDLAYCVHAALPDLELNIPSSGHVPLDLCIVLAWEPLVAPLMLPEVQGDILRLVHRSNKFEHLSSARLKVGDVVTASSTVQAVAIEKSGRSVVVRAVISRDGVPLVAVTSDFLFKGAFTDFANTFKRTAHPPFQLRLSTAIDEAVLKAQPWLKLDDTTTTLANRSLTFDLASETTWKDRTTFATLSTTGAVYSDSGARIGTVSCAARDCLGDPVLDYLTRKAATPVGAPVPLQEPGWIDDSTKEFQVPPSNDRYARLSADTNPIHVAPVFAAYAGLPGTITHGMYTSAVVRAVLQHLAVEDDAAARFHSWEARFVGMVLPGDRLRVRFAHTAMAAGRMVVSVTASNAESGEAVLEGVAEVEQVKTAYVFTGQGSQGVGMGMGLYAESEVARKVWDDVDRALREMYGWSILDIVRTNPKSLTISFGGPKGHRIRQNYLAMTIEKVLPDGHTTVTEPMIKDLTPDSSSYTFYEPRGLLFSTQFAQPAILLQEMATFLDMRARGLVQEGAPFAGHSLGEYGALAAMADFLPVETLVRVIFYRGLTMQVAMERDEFGRTEYGMAAANPGRVGRWFNEEMLKEVVGMIAETSGSLLEIVNLNVEGEQYVCAGKLENLHALTTILTHLSRAKDSSSLLTTPSSRPALQSLITQHVQTASTLPRPIDLQRGAATIPLKGIDVPFHSSHLLHGVQPYRNFLRRSIAAEDVDPSKLVGRYVPNVTAKPFGLDEEYVALVGRVTGSPVLGRLVGRAAEVVAA
ncbi:Fatty acid synthase subunit beta [Lasiodiplodia hormozganensis]|uniref:S-acyl fatty acid synthase thioesterase n=1 Tax=Lasiodiplodia hormozganensis TaxID=869390 RepID=A0AA40CSJ4_9PEZI|nr:Fatty acid synthase subunit beta [Lasiodiplodia hormozganensis]